MESPNPFPNAVRRRMLGEMYEARLRHLHTRPFALKLKAARAILTFFTWFWSDLNLLVRERRIHLWSSFFIIKKVTGIQIIHCSVDSFNKFLVSEAHTLSIGHRIGTLGSLPSIRIGRISLKSFCTLPQSRRSILYQEHCFQCFYHWPGRPLLSINGHRTLTPIHS